ncbi:ATP-binding cassette domain-containing protein [Lentzea sp. NPDC051838]|uniref:ATP-binding cassette domain-containing protein n=1 Tax=Lentzea sp. NPDC051838 TaxID=3154849 RepID=UPI00342D42EC
MIEVAGLTKSFGRRVAVQDLHFRADPGQVTGFLGPNGAGKSTTLRMVTGLIRPDAGFSTVNGVRYQELAEPLREVGSLLDLGAAHPGRKARDHLLLLAATNGIPARRVDEVLGLTGLESVARKRCGTFSLGMKQRLGLASALLGDPPVLILDEPLNGLDTAGIRWTRDLLRGFANEGRTILVSSHMMGELQHTADKVVVIGKGSLIADTDTATFIANTIGHHVRVETASPEQLAGVLRDAGGVVEAVGASETLDVKGLPRREIGELAAAHGITLYGLADRETSLEQAFLESTDHAIEYHPASR